MNRGRRARGRGNRGRGRNSVQGRDETQRNIQGQNSEIGGIGEIRTRSARGARGRRGGRGRPVRPSKQLPIDTKYFGQQNITRSRARLMVQHGVADNCFVRLERSIQAFLNRNVSNAASTASANSTVPIRPSRRASIASTSLFSIGNQVIEAGFDRFLRVLRQRIRTGVRNEISQQSDHNGNHGNEQIETSEAVGNVATAEAADKIQAGIQIDHDYGTVESLQNAQALATVAKDATVETSDSQCEQQFNHNDAHDAADESLHLADLFSEVFDPKNTTDPNTPVENENNTATVESADGQSEKHFDQDDILNDFSSGSGVAAVEVVPDSIETIPTVGETGKVAQSDPIVTSSGHSGPSTENMKEKKDELDLPLTVHSTIGQNQKNPAKVAMENNFDPFERVPNPAFTARPRLYSVDSRGNSVQARPYRLVLYR